MTEQEIIDYLKKNKKEGRILAFMPEEVRDWCEKHLCEKHLKELLVWQSHRWYKFDADDICTDDAVTLPDDYPYPKQESKGGWMEFEIDDDGTFFVNGLTVLWFNWQHVLSDSYGKKDGFTAFGGWQYEDSKRWYLAPAVKLQDGKMWNSYIIEESGEATPVIPVKIRFWRREIK